RYSRGILSQMPRPAGARPAPHPAAGSAFTAGGALSRLARRTRRNHRQSRGDRRRLILRLHPSTMPESILTQLIDSHPELESLKPAIEQAYSRMKTCFDGGGKLLLCGNGGSASDADHWSGEMLK